MKKKNALYLFNCTPPILYLLWFLGLMYFLSFFYFCKEQNKGGKYFGNHTKRSGLSSIYPYLHPGHESLQLPAMFNHLKCHSIKSVKFYTS